MFSPANQIARYKRNHEELELLSSAVILLWCIQIVIVRSLSVCLQMTFCSFCKDNLVTICWGGFPLVLLYIVSS